MVQEERTRGRPPLSEREKAFRVAARLYVRVQDLQVRVEQQLAEPAPASPGRPATSASVLLKQIKRKFREAMTTLHDLERSEGLRLSKPSSLVVPTYAPDHRPGRPLLTPLEKLTRDIQKEKSAIEGLIETINVAGVDVEEPVRMGRPKRSPAEQLVIHRTRLRALQRDLIKERAAEEKRVAQQERLRRQQEASTQEIEAELKKTQQKMDQLRKKLVDTKVAPKKAVATAPAKRKKATAKA